MRRRQLIEAAHRIVTDPYRFVQARSGESGRYIGYNCLFAPEEMLHAAGFIPIRIFGENKGVDTSEKYIPSQCCDFVKHLISAVDKGAFRFLEAAVFGFCCDTMQVVSSILKERRLLEVFTISIPTKFGGPLARDYLVKELDLFRRSLERRLNATVTEAALRESLRVYQENDRLLKAVKDLKNASPESLSTADFLAVLGMGYFTPKEAHNAYLKALLAAFADGNEPGAWPAGRPKRIILSGFLNNDIALVRRIERLGASVVDDDLCEGSRYLTGGVGSDAPPEALAADRMLSRYCPVKSESGMDYADRLIQKCSAHAADGVVIFLFRFCDPQSLEFAMAKPRLAEAKIPTLVLEPAVGGDSFKQMETRLEAFIESI